ISQRLNRRRVGGANQDRTDRVLPVEIGADLIQLAPDFAVEGRVSCVEDADHFPLAAPEAHSLPGLRVRITLGHRFTDDDFALPRLEPSPAGLNLRAAHLDADLR